ncbi:MAG: ankyrin repeat domain-containing protein [Flavobacteriaceae bacterium]|nr:ankyrin repeat domain-containing protein [Flavobacteriaceae bacterium]
MIRITYKLSLFLFFISCSKKNINYNMLRHRYINNINFSKDINNIKQNTIDLSDISSESDNSSDSDFDVEKFKKNYFIKLENDINKEDIEVNFKDFAFYEEYKHNKKGYLRLIESFIKKNKISTIEEILNSTIEYSKAKINKHKSNIDPKFDKKETFKNFEAKIYNVQSINVLKENINSFIENNKINGNKIKKSFLKIYKNHFKVNRLLNYEIVNGKTLLHQAIEVNNIEIFDLLIKYGADINLLSMNDKGYKTSILNILLNNLYTTQEKELYQKNKKILNHIIDKGNIDLESILIILKLKDEGILKKVFQRKFKPYDYFLLMNFFYNKLEREELKLLLNNIPKSLVKEFAENNLKQNKKSQIFLYMSLMIKDIKLLEMSINYYGIKPNESFLEYAYFENNITNLLAYYFNTGNIKNIKLLLQKLEINNNINENDIKENYWEIIKSLYKMTLVKDEKSEEKLLNDKDKFIINIFLNYNSLNELLKKGFDPNYFYRGISLLNYVFELINTELKNLDLKTKDLNLKNLKLIELLREKSNVICYNLDKQNINISLPILRYLLKNDIILYDKSENIITSLDLIIYKLLLDDDNNKFEELKKLWEEYGSHIPLIHYKNLDIKDEFLTYK